MSFPAPSVIPPSLANFQLQYNGLTLGQGTPYGVVTVEGLDLPAVRSGDVARPRATGEFIGIDLLGGREVTITMDAQADGTSLQHALVALGTAFGVPAGGQTESPLWVQLPGLPLLNVTGRTRKRQIPVDVAWTVGSFATKVIVQLHCTDPRVYGTTQVATMTLTSPSAGFSFPLTFPLTFGSGSPSAGFDSALINNTGNIEMKPIIVFTGPVTNPIITNQTTGLSLAFSNPNQTGYTLNAGDQLIVDMDQHTCVYYPSGSSVGTSVRNWLVYGSTWWNIPPGVNDVQFDSADASLPSPIPTCAVEWAPSWNSLT